MVDMAEAVNWRTASKAQIKRSSAKARADAGRLDREVLAELTDIYQRAGDEIKASILQYADGAESLRLDVLQDLLRQINAQLDALRLARDTLLNTGMVRAAQIGASVYDSIMSTNDINRIADEAVRWSRSFIANDGLQLSDRLWRIDRAAKADIGHAIESAVIQGHSATRAAQDFIARGTAVPKDVADKMGMANARAVASSAGQALMKTEGNPYDSAMRLFRTEINRAHGEAYMMTGEEHPDFGGWKFLLSPNHPRPDICDMHSRANLHGLGPGVYPSRERCPWPAHPNTLSYTEIVFSDEITDADKSGKQDRLEWLGKQRPLIQVGVLGSQMKVGALNYGVLKENEIGTPWNILQKKYQGRGIPIDKIRGAIAAKPSGIKEFEPVGVPVSNALSPQAYKQLSDHVLGLIDSIHGDGVLPEIPIKRSASQKFYGAYSYYLDGRPITIALSTTGDHKELTLAHEIGHFIDHQGIEPGKYGSENSAKFSEWVSAVQSSRAIVSLRNLLSGPDYIVSGDKRYRVEKRRIKYLLDAREVWARCYAQYIATKSGDEIMTAQLRDMLQRISTAPVAYTHQWDDDDFEPIIGAMDNLFVKFGWMREKSK